MSVEDLLVETNRSEEEFQLLKIKLVLYARETYVLVLQVLNNTTAG